MAYNPKDRLIKKYGTSDPLEIAKIQIKKRRPIKETSSPRRKRYLTKTYGTTDLVEIAKIKGEKRKEIYNKK